MDRDCPGILSALLPPSLPLLELLGEGGLLKSSGPWGDRDTTPTWSGEQHPDMGQGEWGCIPASRQPGELGTRKLVQSGWGPSFLPPARPPPLAPECQGAPGLCDAPSPCSRGIT